MIQTRHNQPARPLGTLVAVWLLLWGVMAIPAQTPSQPLPSPNQPLPPGFRPTTRTNAPSLTPPGQVQRFQVFPAAPGQYRPPTQPPPNQGQSQFSPINDPLMQLMLSQPKIDVDGPVTATASFDPPVVRPGEGSVYRLVFNALEVSIVLPDPLPADEELHLRAGGRGQILQMTGTNMQPRTTFLFHVRTDSLGRFEIPEFTVQVYDKQVKVPGASLEVTPRPPESIPRAQRLKLEFPRTNVFAGQAVSVRVSLPGESSGVVQTLTQVQLMGDGFIADQSMVRQRIEANPQLGNTVPHFIYETVVIPVASGKLTAYAQAYSVGNRFSGQVVISGAAQIMGGMTPYTLVDSDPVPFVVRALPNEGKLPGFSGAVGSFVLDAPKLEQPVVNVGNPVKLTVRVRGSGGSNIGRLVAPPAPPRSPEWQVFPATSDNTLPTQIIQAQGFASFNYTLIPMSDKPRETPPIPFSYFDPVKEVYVDLTIPPVRVDVLPGNTTAQPELLAQAVAAEQGKREPDPVLSTLASSPGLTANTLVPLQQRAWFPLLQLAPGAFFLGLFLWDRRRRYLEAHPGVMLRRRARRALRRQRRLVSRAVSAGSVTDYASEAVEALRVATAPHFPAEPRALVCTDVLPLLPEADRVGRSGEVVRKIFSVYDAVQFGETPPLNGELLALHPDFEQVLQRLEDKL